MAASAGPVGAVFSTAASASPCIAAKALMPWREAPIEHRGELSDPPGRKRAGAAKLLGQDPRAVDGNAVECESPHPRQPVGLDPADRAADRNAGRGREAKADDLDLAEHVADERRSVFAVYEQTTVNNAHPPARANGVDDRDAARADSEVVDGGAGTGHAPVVQEPNAGAGEKFLEPTGALLALGPTRPARLVTRVRGQCLEQRVQSATAAYRRRADGGTPIHAFHIGSARARHEFAAAGVSRAGGG